ncbi:MAG TPA: sigma-70 family RNA polymerase sigma factor [Gemmataceae bacterium]|nr:sigma-70 family RNA polymerase sigma factor [Gemmataceae bacterium]
MAGGGSRVILRHIRQLADNSADASATDRELLRRFAAHRDQAAFAALVRRHGRLVFGVCRRVLGEEHDAEDAFQATFLILARKAGAPFWRESIGNWLYQIAFRLAVRMRRQAGRRQQRERYAGQRCAADPLAEITLREAQLTLDEELSRLPHALRAPIVLCCLEGNTRDEAAQSLGWSVSTLKRRLERGREVLAVRLRRRGLTIPAVLTGLTLAEAANPAAPATLLTSTVQACMLSGSAIAGGAVTPQTAMLAGAMLRSMLLRNVKIALAVTLAAIGLGGLGAGMVMHELSASDDAASRARPAAVVSADKPRDDGQGDPLPPGALLRLGNARLRHKTSINSTAFALDGSILIAAGDDGVSTLWSPATGKEIRQVATLGPLTVSPDGKTLASLGPGRVMLWDVGTAQPLRNLSRDAGYAGGCFTPVVFAPDGRTIAALSGEQSVAAWDVATGRETMHSPRHETQIACIGFSGKNVLTAVGSRQKDIVVRRWDSETGAELPASRLPAPGGEVWLRPLAFSPDGNTIALEEAATARRKKGAVTNVFTEYRLRLVEVLTGRVSARLDAEPEVVWSAAFSRDGQRVACQRMDGSVGVWNSATGALLFRQQGYPNNSRPDGATTLAFTPDAKTLATAGQSGAIHLWDVATGRERLPISETHHASVTSVVYAPDGKTIATASRDHTIRLWDAVTGRQRLLLIGHTAEALLVAFSPDGRMLASAGGDDTICLWDCASGKQLNKLVEKRQSHSRRTMRTNYGVHGLSFSPNGQTLTSWGEDQMLRVWSLPDGHEVSARQVRLQGVPDVVQLDSVEPRSHDRAGWINECAFTPDGKTLLLAYNTTVYLVDVASGQEVFQIAIPAEHVCLDLSPDGATLAVGSTISLDMGRTNNTVHLFELATGKEILQVKLPWALRRATFAADSRRLAVAASSSPAAIFLLDVASPEQIRKIEWPDAYVNALAFRPDGKVLASSLSNGTTLLWDHAVTSSSKNEPVESASPDKLWTDLASADAAKAQRTVWSLATHSALALRIFKERLHAAPASDAKRIENLIADLDDKQYAKREAAARELLKLRSAADRALRAVLQQTSSAEIRQRITAILAAPPPWLPQDPEALRRLRAVGVLNHIHQPEAESLLEMLARGEPTARATDLAKVALERRPRVVP